MRIVLALLISTVLVSCLRQDDFSDIPNIEFKEMYAEENSVVVVFNFTDGDGDIGLKDDEVLPPFGPCDPFYKNLVVDPYRLVEGEFVLSRYVRRGDCLAPGSDSVFLNDTIGYDQRIKYLVQEGNNKTLEGEIQVTLNEALIEFECDTILFKLRLQDRALNFSNEIETDVVVTECL